MADDRSNDEKPSRKDQAERKPAEETSKRPPAGPHADPSLVNEEATPGTGTLPPANGEPGGGRSVSS